MRVFREPGNSIDSVGRVPGEPGDWDAAVRATSDRVTVANTANPPAELKNTIVTEREVVLNDLPPGPVKITITSRNSKGRRMERAGSAAT